MPEKVDKVVIIVFSAILIVGGAGPILIEAGETIGRWLKMHDEVLPVFGTGAFMGGVCGLLYLLYMVYLYG